MKVWEKLSSCELGGSSEGMTTVSRINRHGREIGLVDDWNIIYEKIFHKRRFYLADMRKTHDI